MTRKSEGGRTGGARRFAAATAGAAALGAAASAVVALGTLGGLGAVAGVAGVAGLGVLGGAAEAQAAKEPPPPALPLWNRTFATTTNADRGNLGPITFVQTGNTVHGTYALGTLRGRVNGQVLIGTLDDGIAGKGTFTVRLNTGDYDSFSGSLRFNGRHTFNGTYARAGDEPVNTSFAMKLKPPKSVARRGIQRGQSATVVLNMACTGPDFHPGDERLGVLVLFSPGVSLDTVLPAQRVASFTIQPVGDQEAVLVYPGALGQRKDRCVVALLITVPADYPGDEVLVGATVDVVPSDTTYEVTSAPDAEVRIAVR